MKNLKENVSFLLLLAFIYLNTKTVSLAFTCIQSHRISLTLLGSNSNKLKSRLKYYVRNSLKIQQKSQSSSINMRDLSSANVFQIGEKVKVVSSVIKAGFDLNGRMGEVIETWEKCDVDPTCCCAEFVDENFAVTVKFEGCMDGDKNESTSNLIEGLNDYFTHFFSEEELLKVNDNKEQNDPSESTKQVPFDGMSCKTFKLNQLKMGEQAQRIAAYEESNASQENNNTMHDK
mmetsp:Transcript_15812/g.19278  ORF Transcript_15812/g.19278 Transcript_15812/m.19278 type:complete len:232 (-) Transcript_15812:335-1030(-)